MENLKSNDNITIEDRLSNIEYSIKDIYLLIKPEWRHVLNAIPNGYLIMLDNAIREIYKIVSSHKTEEEKINAINNMILEIFPEWNKN
jgi:hypothetical protein